MATSSEKFQLVIEAKDAASRQLAQLRKELADLGGPEMVKSQREINKLEREIRLLNGEAKKGSGFFSSMTQSVALGTLAAQAATAAWRMLSNQFTDVFKVAGESQKVWTQTVASLERHGLATDENIRKTHEFASSMQMLTGVADEQYARAIQTMVDRGASLEQAFKLTSLAADAAASTNRDLSATMIEFADSVGKDSIRALKKYGVNLGEVKSLSQGLDAAINQMTANFGGAALDATNSFDVRMKVLGETFGDLKEQLGFVLMPVIQELGETLTAFLSTLTTVAFGDTWSEEAGKVVGGSQGIIDVLESMQGHMTAIVNIIVGGVKVIWNAIQIVVGSIRLFLAPVVDMIVGIDMAIINMAKATAAVLEGEFTEAWNLATEGVSSFVDGFSNASDSIVEESMGISDNIDDLMMGFVQLTDGIGQTTEAVDNTTSAMNKAKQTVTDLTSKVTESAQATVAAGEQWMQFTEYVNTAGQRQLMVASQVTGDYVSVNGQYLMQAGMSWDQFIKSQESRIAESAANASGYVGVGSQQIEDVTETASAEVAAFMQGNAAIVENASDQMIDHLLTGRGSMAEIFSGMAQDFMHFFIKTALSALVSSFIPGLGSILGGIFDTPVNDRMAARQGRDFMSWFTRGALAEANGGSELAVGITNSTGRGGSGINSGGGSGPTMINVQMSGNVMSDSFVEKNVAPTLQRLVAGGKSLLSLQSKNQTGIWHVRLN